MTTQARMPCLEEGCPSRRKWDGYCHAHYAERFPDDPRGLMARQRAFSVAHHAKRKALVDAMKLERGCIDCGYNANAEALDFDHRDGETHRWKNGFGPNLTCSWEALTDEIAKCDVRCRNCHVIRTSIEMRRRVADGEYRAGNRRRGPQPRRV